MGGWKLEAGRFFVYVTFPVASFWLFNQPFFYDYAMKKLKQPEYEVAHQRAVSGQVSAWKEELREERKVEAQEKILREKMAFEEARRYREKHNI